MLIKYLSFESTQETYIHDYETKCLIVGPFPSRGGFFVDIFILLIPRHIAVLRRVGDQIVLAYINTLYTEMVLAMDRTHNVERCISGNISRWVATVMVSSILVSIQSARRTNNMTCLARGKREARLCPRVLDNISQHLVNDRYIHRKDPLLRFFVNVPVGQTCNES